MSVGIAVSLAVMATLGVVFVYTNSTSPQRVGPTHENMEELKQKLMVLQKARKAYRKMNESDEIQANQDAYDEYISILKKKPSKAVERKPASTSGKAASNAASSKSLKSQTTKSESKAGENSESKPDQVSANE